MKLGEIFRFEIGLQSRRVSTWLYCAVLLGLAFQTAREVFVAEARSDGYVFNAPFAVASVTVLGGLLGLLVPAALAGDAAARDVRTRMHPLFYTAPVGKAAYLGGRFLAAFAMSALLLAALPAGVLLAALLPGVEAELVGPFRPSAYLGAYLFLALPNAFVATALPFSLAALGRRAMTSYLGAVLLFFAAVFSWQFVAGRLGQWELAKLLDPLGLTTLAELSRAWTPLEKSTRLIGLEGPLLWNRLLWLGLALGVLALTHLRFRFAHPPAGARRASGARRWTVDPASSREDGAAPLAVPRVPRTFGPATRARQTLAVARESFREIATGWGGLALAAIPVLLVLTGPQVLQHLGVPLLPATEQVARLLAPPLAEPGEIVWMVVPLLVVFYAGELVWREREARLGEIADAAPAPDWVPFLGKFVGLGLVLLAFQALLMAAGMLLQALLGHRDFQPGVYARVLFGLQLADHLLFALLALVVHALVDHKYVGHLALAVAYAGMAFAPALGIEHHLLVYGSAPGWAYSEMRGFGPSLAGVVWLKLYWAAWALLLAWVAGLLWVRGTERGRGWRLRLARRRCTRPAARAGLALAGLVLALGGFVFYNTNVLNEYRTASERAERRAGYERRYGRYAGVAQPQLTGTRLHVEIHPRRRAVEIRGSYRLVNRSAAAIGTVHLATSPDVETGPVGFDRPAARVLVDEDEELGHRIYALETPLEPGDSLRLDFRVRFAPRGFPNGGADASVAANGTHFVAREWLPALGYQPERELAGVAERRAHGLAPRPAVRPLHDARARHDLAGAERIRFEAVVGTDLGQVAVAPGALRRTWTAGGRRYFHYATDAPIRNDYAFFSAAYALREARWTHPSLGPGQDVAIQVFHHPGHARNLERMVRSARASLDYHAERFGPYPHRQLRLVEHPGRGPSLHAYPINISYREGFSLLDPERDPRDIDFPFAVVAHEVAHQWWGNQVSPAFVQGGPLLSESLAWYAALGVVEETYGPGHLRRLLGMMREAYLTPRARAAPPLLRSYDRFLAYRKGPFAMYALREYVGEERVNGALRRLFEQHGAGAPPLPTSLDLYRELRAVTPDSLRSLLADLFEANTFWELAAERAAAERTEAGAWRVTLDVRARKVVVDSAGAETEVPMHDLVEIGVFARAEDGGPGEPLYLRRHRVRSGGQRITVTVPREPARAGIDPRSLLIDLEAGDNLAPVARAGVLPLRGRGSGRATR